jgi:hypothetical protein
VGFSLSSKSEKLDGDGEHWKVGVIKIKEVGEIACSEYQYLVKMVKKYGQ